MNGLNKDFDALLVSASKELIDKTADELNNIDTSDVELPSSLNKKIARRIKAHERKKKYGRCVRMLKNVAAGFLIVCTASLFLCLSVDGIKAEIWNIVEKQSDDRTIVYFQTNADVPIEIETFKEPKIRPEGLIKKVMWQAPDIQMIYYFENEDDDPFSFIVAMTQRPVNESELKQGSNGVAVISEVMVNQTSARVLQYPNGRTFLLWHDNDYTYSLVCMDGSVDVDFMIRMAESVQ